MFPFMQLHVHYVKLMKISRSSNFEIKGYKGNGYFIK